MNLTEEVWCWFLLPGVILPSSDISGDVPAAAWMVVVVWGFFELIL